MFFLVGSRSVVKLICKSKSVFIMIQTVVVTFFVLFLCYSSLVILFILFSNKVSLFCSGNFDFLELRFCLGCPVSTARKK